VNYLLNTDTCISFLNNKHPQIKQKLTELNCGDIKIPSIVAAELFYGAAKSRQISENLTKVRDFLALYEILPFNGSAAKNYGMIRAVLESKGNAPGLNDMLIAAAALSSDGILVTCIPEVFSRIPGLQTEDWTVPHRAAA
jgi:tRNA(fMet)-specific endonuclease VapC